MRDLYQYFWLVDLALCFSKKRDCKLQFYFEKMEDNNGNNSFEYITKRELPPTLIEFLLNEMEAEAEAKFEAKVINNLQRAILYLNFRWRVSNLCVRQNGIKIKFLKNFIFA